MIGHLLGAAGAVEVIASLLALRERVTPPTVGWEEREEGMDLDYVPEARQLKAKNGDGAVAISNAFGFGGHNAVVCIRAASHPRRHAPRWRTGLRRPLGECCTG